MLRVWLLVGLLPACLCSGLYPAPSVTSVEAHGPLARLSLHHGLPLSPAALLPPTHRLEDITVAQAPIAELQAEARRPAVQKQFHYIEQGTIVQPVFSAVLKHDEPLPSQFVSHVSFLPVGHHTLAQFNQPLLYPVDCRPVVSDRPLQESHHHFYPVVSHEIPKPPQQYPATPQPPHLLPSIPHQPQQLPTVPTIPQTPTSPQVPQKPVNTDTKPSDQFSSLPTPSTDEFSNDEFDYSDAIVVENPDFTRSRQSDGQSSQDQESEDSPDEFEREAWEPELTAIVQKNTEQERIIQNIVKDFTNLQLLRMSSSQTVPKKLFRTSTERSNYQTTYENPILPMSSQKQEVTRPKNNQLLRKSHENGLNENNDLDFNVYENEKKPSSQASLDKLSSEKDISLQYRLYLNHLQALSDQTKTDAAKTKSDQIGDISLLRDVKLEVDVRRRLLELLTGSERTEMSPEAAVKGRLLTTPCDKTHVQQQPLTHVQQPVAHVQQPLKHVQQPLTHVQQPLTHEQQPLTHEQQPLAHVQQPLTHVQQPLTHEQQPLTHEQQPLTHVQLPLTHESRVEHPRTLQPLVFY